MSNELRPYRASDPTAAGSIFNNFEEFQAALQMATALSKTTLIPQNFQGKPEDCVVAIDYSRRLGVPPTAVMPHLYVINGRPSLSAQFMISLVNRSGAFSRIQWKERAEGTVDYTFNREKRTLPNYSAVASFKELATGKTYESPIVDVKLAWTSGWLVKRDKYGKESESLWTKNPQLMCRYRSAAELIKTVCPELSLGMDITDGSGGEPIAAAEPEPIIERRVEATIQQPVDVQSHEERFLEMKAAISTAGTAALKFLGRQIADSGLPEKYLDELREDYRRRLAELAAEDVARRSGIKDSQPSAEVAHAATQADVEPVRENASGDNMERVKGDPPVVPEALAASIKAADNFGALTAAWSEAESEFAFGNLASADYDAFVAAYEARVKDLRQKYDEPERELFTAFIKDSNAAEGSNEQKEWAQELARTIFNQTDAAAIVKNNLRTADEWLASGALTEGLHAAVGKYARARIDAFFGAENN